MSIDTRKGVALDLPPGIEHEFVYVVPPAEGHMLYLDGVAVEQGVGPGKDYVVEITHEGHFELTEH